MEKKDKITIVVFILSTFLIMNMVAFYLLKKELATQKQSIRQAQRDSLLAQVDTLSADKQDKPLNDLLGFSGKLLNPEQLKKMLVNPTVAQDTQDQLQLKVDQVLEVQKGYIEKINALLRENASQKAALEAKDQHISELMEQLQTQQDQPKTAGTAQDAKRRDDNYQYLARTYDSMKAKDAVLSMMRLDDQDVIEILKRMNERARGKVMAAMPPARAAQIARSMTQ